MIFMMRLCACFVYIDHDGEQSSSETLNNDVGNAKMGASNIFNMLPPQKNTQSGLFFNVIFTKQHKYYDC